MSPLDLDGAAFADALLDAGAAPPDGLVAWHGGPVARRFGVYRNNVVCGLVDALGKRFPVCAQLVGDDFFRAMAGVFVRLAPPRSSILADYGDGFADFIESFAPARELVYLPDVARLEFSIGCAYRAADAEPLAIEALAALEPSDYARKSFALHPSLRWMRSRFPVVSIWRAHVAGAALADIDLSIGEDALAARPHLDVTARVLPPGGVAFLEALTAQASLAAAAGRGGDAARDFNLAETLGALLSCGGVIGVFDAA